MDESPWNKNILYSPFFGVFQLEHGLGNETDIMKSIRLLSASAPFLTKKTDTWKKILSYGIAALTALRQMTLM